MVSPRSDSYLDTCVKNDLVADTIRLVSPPYFDRTVWAEMVRWRLAEHAGERARHAMPPAFTSELMALLHGETTHFAGREPPSDA